MHGNGPTIESQAVNEQLAGWLDTDTLFRNIVKMSQHEEDSDEGVDEVFGALMEGAEDVNDEFANYSQETQKKPKTVSPKKSTTSSSSKPKASSSNNPSSSTNQPSKLSKQSSPVKVPVVQVKKPSNSPTKVRKK